MTNTESKRKTTFIVVFSIIALLINSTQHRSFSAQNVGSQPQMSQAEMERAATAQKTAADAAAEHSKFLARYLNSGFSKTPGSKTIAIVVATQDGKLDHTISTALADHFKSNNVKITTSFFKPEFVSDKLFANVFDGSTTILNQLELVNSLDALLLARETVQVTKNPASLDNVLTANIVLEVQVVPVTGNIQNQSWKFTVAGAGFSQAEAQSNADERLIKQITNDTKMSLNN